MKTTNKILMIINEFPPTGESGVQRPLKFLKFLSKANWETFVITPNKPTKDILDPTLLQDIPLDTSISRTYSLGLVGKGVDHVANIRANVEGSSHTYKSILWKSLKFFNDLLFPIDKQIGWVPFACVKSIQLIKKHNIRNIYITAFPFSAFIIGLLLKLIFGKRIYWVADYRDAWQFAPQLSSSIHKFRMKVIIRWDRNVLESADRIVFVSDFIRDRYLKEYPWINSKSVTINNGYDEDDFSHLIPYKFDRYTFLFMGKLYTGLRDPSNVLTAIQKSDQISEYQFVHIGSCPTDLLAELYAKFQTVYDFWNYKPHHEALNYASGAAINVVIFSEDESSLSGMPGGKFFELLRIGKPILAVGPDSSRIREYLRQYENCRYAYLEDEMEITRCIRELIHISETSETKMIYSEFSRENLTKELISLYDDYPAHY